MKKNRMMRSASALLVMVLLTTSVISGTFAKYTTQDSANDSARVAKWGVELQAVGNLYGDTYGAGNKIVKFDDSTGFSVQSFDAAQTGYTGDNTAADVVAPGTQNDEGFTFSLKGQPEVDGTITTEMKIQNVFLKAGTYGIMIPVDAGVVTEANFSEFATGTDPDDILYTINGSIFEVATAASTNFYTLEDYVVTNDYYPVVYKLSRETTELVAGNTTSDSLAAVAAYIADTNRLNVTGGTPDADTSVTYTGTPVSFESNTNLTSFDVNDLTLTWAWEFGDVNKVGDTADTTDKADTILGLIENTTDGTVVKLSGSNYVPVVEYTDYCLDTQFSIDITVTQVD